MNKEQVYGKIMKTEDYERFGLLKHNRELNTSHISKLKASMIKKCLISPILVNENFEIIDGQHRFVSLRELGLPVYYYIVAGYGYQEVQILNINQQNWSLKDYHYHYLSRGKPEYRELNNFMKDNGLTLKAGMILSSSQDIITKRDFYNIFKTGDYKFSNNKANEWANYFNQIKNFWDFSSQHKFLIAFCKLLNNPVVDWDRFRDQANKYSHMVENRPSYTDYLKAFQKMYNYHKKDKYSIYEEDL